MTIKVAINGFGRIGRNILRAVYECGLTEQVKVVAINELADAKGIAHLLKYDTSHGRFGFPVELTTEGLLVNGDAIALFCQADPAQLPWNELEVDVVLECTGVFHSRADAQLHLDAGAKKVLFSQLLPVPQLSFNEDVIHAGSQIITPLPPPFQTAFVRSL